MKDSFYNQQIQELAVKTEKLADETIQPLYEQNDYDEDQTMDELQKDSSATILWSKLDAIAIRLAEKYNIDFQEVQGDVWIQLMFRLYKDETISPDVSYTLN